jgi:hypothetical protein
VSRQESQQVRAPFCIVPVRYVSDPGALSPRAVALAVAGVAITAFGCWDLVQTLPDYSVPVTIILFGAALLWFGGAQIVGSLRRRGMPTGYWIGCQPEHFSFVQHDLVVSKPWPEIGEFRVTESATNEFVTTYRARPFDDKIDFVQTASIRLATNPVEGPPIEIPFDDFIDIRQDRRIGADTLCLFLNDVRHRALNGGLGPGSKPFPAPPALQVMPMRERVSTESKLMPATIRHR